MQRVAAACRPVGSLLRELLLLLALHISSSGSLATGTIVRTRAALLPLLLALLDARASSAERMSADAADAPNPFDAFRFEGRKQPIGFSVHMGASPRGKASSRGKSGGTSSAGAEGPKKAKKAKKAQLSQPPDVGPNFDGWLPIYERGRGGVGSHDEIMPVISGTPGGWRERWAGVCDDCFQQGVQCGHYDEHPLTMLIIGHNPSVKTWEVLLPE